MASEPVFPLRETTETFHKDKVLGRASRLKRHRPRLWDCATRLGPQQAEADVIVKLQRYGETAYYYANEYANPNNFWRTSADWARQQTQIISALANSGKQ